MPERMRRFAANVLAIAYRDATGLRHDPAFLGMVAAQPVIMVLLFGFALSNEPANVPWGVLDQSRSAPSRRLVQEIEATGYFVPPRAVGSYDEARDLLGRGKVVAIVVIANDFHRDARRGSPAIQLLLDGADPLTAARVGSYIGQVARHFDPDGRGVEARRADRAALPRDTAAIAPRPRFWFNASLRDRDFFLSVIVGMLLTNLCLSVSSLGIVGERESGTYEATLALPTTPLEIVLGKLLPFVPISYCVIGLTLGIEGLLFGFWPQGSWIALAILTLPFVLASLAIGVVVSALGGTSAQAVFLSVFAILPSFILSGVMFPYALMPDGIRQAGSILPLRWYQIGLRRIILRGASLDDVLVPIAALTLLLALLLVLARSRMKPRLG